MTLTLTAVTYLVRDYDEAIHWFTQCIGFQLLEDTDMGGGKRWVRVAAAGSGSAFILAKAANAAQQQAIANAAGGRVAYFLHTDDFAGTHQRMTKAGIIFREQPRHESYGTVAVFEDLYGNGWDLIGPPR
jgi:catechol 2,3-dioxygenase-like lactoylglutathione lyase family enzyme